MKTLDFILPAHTTASASDHETLPLPRAAKKAAEPFDSLMHRALDKSVREPAEKNSPVKKSTGDNRAGHPQRPEPTSPRKSKPTSRPETRPQTSAPAASNADASSGVATPNDQATSPEAPVAETAPATVEQSDTTAAQAENQATTLQQTVAAAYLTGAAPSPTTGTAKSSTTTGSPGAGNESTTITAVGTELTAGLAPVGEKNPEPGQRDHSEKGKEIPGSPSDPAKISGPTGGAVPIQALMEKAEQIEENPANVGNPATDKPHSAALDATGISAAQQAATMNKAEHAAKVAGATEQSLPGVTVVSALESAARSKPANRTAARVEASDAPVTANLSNAERAPQTSETSASSQISASSQTELRTRALDRTHDIMALQGLRLKETNAGSLHVVIKPGAGLQLSLQLKQTGDGIEAQAILQQGDFNQLNQHWSALQQRLEERGIKLAPLGQENANLNSGNENFQRPSQQSAEQNSLSAGAFAEFASAGAAAARAVPTGAVSSRGWEGWA